MGEEGGDINNVSEMKGRTDWLRERKNKKKKIKKKRKIQDIKQNPETNQKAPNPILVHSTLPNNNDDEEEKQKQGEAGELGGEEAREIRQKRRSRTRIKKKQMITGMKPECCLRL